MTISFPLMQGTLSRDPGRLALVRQGCYLITAGTDGTNKGASVRLLQWFGFYLGGVLPRTLWDDKRESGPHDTSPY